MPEHDQRRFLAQLGDRVEDLVDELDVLSDAACGSIATAVQRVHRQAEDLARLLEVARRAAR